MTLWYLFTALAALVMFATEIEASPISMKKAETLAEKARADSTFPIVMNERVLLQLNRYAGTPSGKRHMRICLQRMKKFSPMISKKINEYKVPAELMAVPLVESSYQNITSEQGWGAGLWMFITSTARNHGLKVNKKVDQRLNVKLATDAALRYLKANHKRFKDWQLALMAYNMGESKVRRAIKQTRSRNPWVLVRKGHEGDKGYLAKVMAVVIIMKNPQLLREA